MLTRTIYPRLEQIKLKLTKREQLVVLEIDTDAIDTASSFVDYMNEMYGLSKSSIWYVLKALKEHGIVEFADKLHSGDPLKLTRLGQEHLRYLAHSKNEIMQMFERQSNANNAMVYTNYVAMG